MHGREKLGNVSGEAYAATHLGQLDFLEGDTEEAARRLVAAARQAVEAQYPQVEGAALVQLADLLGELRVEPSDVASPVEATFTSIRVPVRWSGPSVAETITSATFRAVMSSICDGDLSIGLSQALTLFQSACGDILL